jgi:hypothetical protein
MTGVRWQEKRPWQECHSCAHAATPKDHSQINMA